MFEFVPYFEGYYLNYREFLWLLTFTGFIILSLVSFLFSKLFLWSSNLKALSKQIKKSYANLDNESTFSTTVSTSGPLEAPSDLTEKLGQAEPEKRVCLKKTSTFFSWLAWFFMSYIPGTFAMYGYYVPLFMAIALMFLILMMKLKIEERADQDELETANRWTNISATTLVSERLKIRQFYRRVLILILTLSILVPSTWYGFCVNSFQEFTGVIFGTASLNSALTRYFQVSEQCPKGLACHIYATLPEDTSTGVFINAHTHHTYDNVTFHYDTVDYYNQTGELRYSQRSWDVKIEGVDSQGKRRVHTGYLHDLQPETLYYIRIINDVDHFLGEANYKTFPDEHSQTEIIIANGGDNGDTWLARNLTIASAQYEPDVIVSGGDIAYDNGMCTCWYAWDIFFVPFEELNRIRGRLIPLIFSVGNHDVGVDRMSERDVETTKEGPFYMVYFPQHSRYVNGSHLVHEVPGLHERRSFHYHKIGKLLILGLDSGLVTTYPGRQQKWLENILEAHRYMYKFASYHYPTYPVCPEYDVWDQGWLYRVQLWNPLFDKYKFVSLWENHEHMFKLTNKLRNGKPHPKGSYYLGNGGWGAYGDKSCVFPPKDDIFQEFTLDEHYWIIKYVPQNKKIVYSAYNVSNLEIIPTFEQDLKDYEYMDWKDYENDGA